MCLVVNCLSKMQYTDISKQKEWEQNVTDTCLNWNPLYKEWHMKEYQINITNINPKNVRPQHLCKDENVTGHNTIFNGIMWSN